MSDMSLFSKSSFNSAQWINATLKELPEEESLESYVSSLVTKLHIMSQDYTDQLETAMIESMSTIPRVLNEVSRVEDQLKEVKAEMNGLSKLLVDCDQRNVAGVEDLSRLDALKTNMEKCKSTLEEHARWSQIVREAKGLLEGGGRLSDAADRIETMFRSLEVLQHLPGNEERKETCEGFKVSLLDALRPRVQRDIVSNNMAPLQEYLYVYERLGRATELEVAFVQQRPRHSIMNTWDQYIADQDAKGVAQTNEEFSMQLASYLGAVTRYVSDERQPAHELFGKQHGADILCHMLGYILPPVHHTIERVFCSDQATPEFMCDCHQVLEEFSRRVYMFLEAAEDKQLLQGMTAIFSVLEAQYKTYISCEESSQRKRAAMLLDSVSFDKGNVHAATVAGRGGGDAATASIAAEDAFDLRMGLSDSSDPIEVLARYSAQLLVVADSFTVSLLGALDRCLGYMSGVHAKLSLKSLVSVSTSILKGLTCKIEELGVACGVGVEVLDMVGAAISAGTVLDTGGVSVGGRSSSTAGESSSSPPPSSSSALAVVADPARVGETRNASFIREELQRQDPRQLQRSALGALQAAGRAVRRIAEFELQVRRRLAAQSKILISSDRVISSAAAHTRISSSSLATLAKTTTVGIGAATSPSFLVAESESGPQVGAAPMGAPIGTASAILIRTAAEAITSVSEQQKDQPQQSEVYSSAQGLPRTISGAFVLQLLHANDSSSSNSNGARKNRHEDGTDADTLVDLKNFLVSAVLSDARMTQSPLALLKPSIGRIKAMSVSVLFNLCLSFPSRQLSSYGTERCWADVDPSMEQFSDDASVQDIRGAMLPQAMITQVGEHILSLVQELEMFASSETLMDLTTLTGQVQTLSTRATAWARLGRKLQLGKQEDRWELLSQRTTCAGLVNALEAKVFGAPATMTSTELEAYENSMVVPVALVPGLDQEEHEQEQQEKKEKDAKSFGAPTKGTGEEEILPQQGPTTEAAEAAEAARLVSFVNEWLRAVSDSAVAMLLVEMLEIPVLTPLGAAQLVSDLEYLSNVVNAVGLQPHPLLVHTQYILSRPLRAVMEALHLVPDQGHPGHNLLLKFEQKLVNLLLKGRSAAPMEVAAQREAASMMLPGDNANSHH